MEETCVFCGKKFGLSMPIPVSVTSTYKMCGRCKSNYKARLVEVIRERNDNSLDEEIQRIKDSLGNHSDSLIDAINDIVQEENSRLSREDIEAEQKRAIQREIDANHDKVLKEFEKIRDIPVTTEDINKEYKILGPVVFNTTNRGVFSSVFNTLDEKYSRFPYDVLIVKPKSESLTSKNWGVFFLSLLDASAQFEGGVGQPCFDRAFYIALAEMKMRAAEMGGNAIIGMKMDFDLDTTNFGAFYLQMYGTAVLIEED